MDKKDILQRLNALPWDKSEYWVITGGAMVLYGLREETGDIDLGCSGRLADALERQGCPVTRMADGTRKIAFAKDIELFEDWLRDRVDTVEGLPVVSLRGLLAMKKALGREKDRADIGRIEEFIRGNGGRLIMRKLAVNVGFMNGRYRRQLETAAEKAGFAADFFDSGSGALAPRIGDYEVIYGHPDPAWLKRADRLRWLCSDFAGVEKYLDEAIWPSPDCLLSNSSGAYGPAIAEHTVMALLMLLRRMPEYQAALAERRWPCLTPIRSLAGSHVVMLGTGDIGSNTARRLKALGASVTGVCRSGQSEEPSFDRVVSAARLDEVLPQADALVMALPATAETRGILSRERIALLPPTAFVVNVGRGAAIDQPALVEALQERRLAGAALDVMEPEPLPPDHPLWQCPNTILTPHVSGNMALGLTCDLDVDMFCRDLDRYAAGELPENLVDRRRGY